jgi:hypothetical protein
VLRHQTHVVGDDENGVTCVVQRPETINEPLDVRPIKTSGRFVEDEDGRAKGEERRQGHLASQSIAKRRRWSICVGNQIEEGKGLLQAPIRIER